MYVLVIFTMKRWSFCSGSLEIHDLIYTCESRFDCFCFPFLFSVFDVSNCSSVSKSLHWHAVGLNQNKKRNKWWHYRLTDELLETSKTENKNGKQKQSNLDAHVYIRSWPLSKDPLYKNHLFVAKITKAYILDYRNHSYTKINSLIS